MPVETCADKLTPLKDHLPSTLATGAEPGGQGWALTHIGERTLSTGGEGQGDRGGELGGALGLCETHDGVRVTPVLAVILGLGTDVLTAIRRQGAVLHIHVVN